MLEEEGGLELGRELESGETSATTALCCRPLEDPRHPRALSQAVVLAEAGAGERVDLLLRNVGVKKEREGKKK